MTTTPTSPERPTRRKAWVFVFSVGAMALMTAAIVLWMRQRAAAGRAQIDLRLDAIRAAGEPVTAADLRRRYPAPPPEHDVVNLLAPALNRLSIPEDDEGVPWLGLTPLPSPKNSIGPALASRLEALVNTNRQAMATAGAVGLEGAWFGVEVEDDFALPAIRHETPIRNLSHVLLLSAVVAAEQGDGDSAVKQLLQGLAVGRCFQSGILRHQLVRRIAEQRACEVLERVVNRVGLGKQSLEELIRALAKEDLGGIQQALFDIRAYNIWQLEQLRADPVGSLMIQGSTQTGWFDELKSRAIAQWIALSSRGYRDQDFIDAMDAWSKVFGSLAQTPRQRRAKLNNVAALVSQKRQSRSVAWGVISLPESFLPRIDQDTEIIARLRTARVAMAILCWSAAQDGKLPESLAELVPDTLPAIPADPFDEQPLRYRRLPQGFTVYSVGPDFTDNGGKRQPAGTEKADGYDVVFTVERFHDIDR
jgi:hypothetical protein